MPNPMASTAEYVKISRLVCMLLNRAMMYKADHPQIRDAAAQLYKELVASLPKLSSLSLILHQDQLYMDDEPVDPRINVGRIVALFKKSGIQSISFFNGIAMDELDTLIDMVTAPAKYPDSQAMIAELRFRGVEQLKINHVFYKKITREDEVVARRDLEGGGSGFSGRADSFRKQFMDTLMESVLADEADKMLSMKSLLADPIGVSQRMLTVENKSMAAVTSGKFSASGPGGGAPGQGEAIEPGAALLYQIQTLSDDIKAQMETGGQLNLMDLADAVFEMKRQLTMGIESQKAVNQAYANEAVILDHVNSLTDDVLVRLVREEYRQGKISTTRLAQILRRLLPEPGEIKRLLPKIKIALLADGMPVAEYLTLVRQLARELEGDGLADILRQAAETAGVEGDELIDAIQKNPEQAAQLITIAAEISKGDKDPQAFTDVLVEYVEQLGKTLQRQTAGKGTEKEAQARRMMIDLGAGLTAGIRNMRFDSQALARMEERINARIDEVAARLIAEQGASSKKGIKPSTRERTLLQMMEQSLESSEELKESLLVIRAEADKGAIDENSFEQIYAGIVRYQEQMREKEVKKQMPPGVLKATEFRFHLEKELLRAKRHKLYLSTLAFTIVNVRPKVKAPADLKIKKSELFAAAYHRLVEIARNSDIVGELNPTTMTIILPMANKASARLALGRITKLLHEQSFEINGIPLSVVIAGSVTSFAPEEKPNTEAFIKTVIYELDHVATRVKNVHSLT